MWRHILGARYGILVVLALAGLAACADDAVAPAGEIGPEDAAFIVSPPPPPGVVPVMSGGTTVQLWPFTGTDLAGTQSDPMNLIMTGEVDVVSLRSALMALPGDRSLYGLPNAPPFNCTWSDAFGGVQTTYSDGDGWVANPVQLQCGVFSPVRFHVRLFEAGPWVLGGAHFEVNVLGTTEHEVLDWEAAEALVALDLQRAGAVPVGLAPIYPAPTYRAILKEVYNALLIDAPALLAGLGYPLVPQAADFPLPSDGNATILYMATRPPVVPGTWTNSFTIPWDGSLLVPRPFCFTGTELVKIEGPIHFQQWTSVSATGELATEQVASGELLATPFDVFTNTFGEPFRALIQETQKASVGPQGSETQTIVKRLAVPPAVNGSFRTHLVTSPNGGAQFTLRERCE
jgi:hypothetical protein